MRVISCKHLLWGWDEFTLSRSRPGVEFWWTKASYRSRLRLPVLLCSRSGSWLHNALIQQCPEWDRRCDTSYQQYNLPATYTSNHNAQKLPIWPWRLVHVLFLQPENGHFQIYHIFHVISFFPHTSWSRHNRDWGTLRLSWYSNSPIFPVWPLSLPAGLAWQQKRHRWSIKQFKDSNPSNTQMPVVSVIQITVSLKKKNLEVVKLYHQKQAHKCCIIPKDAHTPQPHEDPWLMRPWPPGGWAWKRCYSFGLGGKSADTHVLIGADQEAVVNVSLHQAGLPHALLSQHDNFGIHTDGIHSNWEQKSPGTEISREAGGQFTSEKVVSDKIKDRILKSKLTSL